MFLKEVCEITIYERTFFNCKKFVDYSRTTYQMWLLIKKSNIIDKLHRLCYNENFCRFPQSKYNRPLNIGSDEFIDYLNKRYKESLVNKQ